MVQYFCFADKTKISFKTQHDLYQNYILFNDDFTYLLVIDEINLYCGDKVRSYKESSTVTECSNYRFNR